MVGSLTTPCSFVKILMNNKEETSQRLGVEERGSVLINLSLIAGFIAHQFSLWPGAVAAYAVGFVLIRKR